jgi:hypothetical protein
MTDDDPLGGQVTVEWTVSCKVCKAQLDTDTTGYPLDGTIVPPGGPTQCPHCHTLRPGSVEGDIVAIDEFDA